MITKFLQGCKLDSIKNWKLSFKLMIIIIPIFVVVMTLLVTYLLIEQKKIVSLQRDIYSKTLEEIRDESNNALRASYESNISSLLDFISKNAIIAFTTFDFAALDRYMQIACRNQDILYAYVTSANGEIVTSFKNINNINVKNVIPASATIQDVIDILPKHYTIIKFDKKISDQGMNLGHVYIGLNTDSLKHTIETQNKKLAETQEYISQQVNKQINQAMVTIFLAVVVIIVFLILVIMFLMHRMLSNPLAKITSFLNLIADGQLKLDKVEIRSKDEIGRISEAFNKMLESLTKLLSQAEYIAADDLTADILNEKIQGDLGGSFSTMIDKLKNLSVQAEAIANDDLNNPVLTASGSGTLSNAFAHMVSNLRKLAEQAQIISRDDLYNDRLTTSGTGVLSSAFSEMVVNLRTLAEQALLISRGQITSDKLSTEKKGTLGSAFAEVIVNLRKLSNQASAIASGDLNSPVLEEKISGDIGDSFAIMTRNLKKLISDLEAIIKNVEGVSVELEDISSSVLYIASDTNKMSMNEAELINTVNSSLTKFSASIQQISENCKCSKSNSTVAKASASEGLSVVKEVNKNILNISDAIRNTADKLTELSDSSKKISNIVDIITSISEKTALLALNASIEAARAGESGKGFAVVADEVNKLAEQTHKSVKDISMLVETIGTQSQLSVQSMNRGIGVVQDGVELTRKSLKAFQKVSSSIEQSDISVVDIADSVMEQSQVIETIVGITDQLQDISQKVLNQSKELNEKGTILGKQTTKLLKVLNKTE